MSETSTRTTCEEALWTGRYEGARLCGKPCKGWHDGRPLCGIHLRSVRIRLERARQLDRESRMRAQARLHADAMVEFGLSVHPGNQPGTVTLSATSAAFVVGLLDAYGLTYRESLGLKP